MKQAWANAWRDRSFRVATLVAIAVILPLVAGLPTFFAHIGATPGWRPPDPVIGALGPCDVTWVIFLVLYAGVAFTLVRVVHLPHLFLRGLHAYTLLQLLRMGAMEAITLEPPRTIIPLVDPITAVFYPGGTPFLKDLFFSGHTATLALMVVISRGRTARYAMVLATIAVAGLVVLQHVHWTVDVLAAPLAVWLAWKGSALTLRACGAEVA